MLEKIRTIIADQLSVEESSIQPETSLTKDLEADSLDFVELIMALEDTFDVCRYRSWQDSNPFVHFR